MQVEHCLQSSAQGRCDGGLSSGYVDGLNVVLMEAPRARLRCKLAEGALGWCQGRRWPVLSSCPLWLLEHREETYRAQLTTNFPPEK